MNGAMKIRKRTPAVSHSRMMNHPDRENAQHDEQEESLPPVVAQP